MAVRAAERLHHAHDPREALAEEFDDGAHLGLERRARVDRLDGALERRGVHEAPHRRGEELLLVGERTEDRALGDARGVGDLLGRDVLPVLDDERDRGVEDHLAAVVHGQRRGAALGGGVFCEVGHAVDAT